MTLPHETICFNIWWTVPCDHCWGCSWIFAQQILGILKMVCNDTQTVFIFVRGTKLHKNVLFWGSTSFKVIKIGTNWKCMCEFILAFNSHIGPISRRFQDVVIKRSKNCPFAYLMLVWHTISREFPCKFMSITYLSKTKDMGLSRHENLFVIAAANFSSEKNMTDRYKWICHS